MTLTDLTLTDALQKLDSREISAVELTLAYLERIEQINPKTAAYRTVPAQRALDREKQADSRRANGENSDQAPLLGIPVAIKDVLCTEGVRTTAGSKILD